MDQIIVDFSKSCGPVKPMHATNNGPVYKFAADQRITNIEPWRAANIPYGRTHDASFYSTYGGEHTVDVNMIFTDFDRDPEDPVRELAAKGMKQVLADMEAEEVSDGE